MSIVHESTGPVQSVAISLIGFGNMFQAEKRTDFTWGEICEREPRLLDLLRDAGSVRVPEQDFWRRWRTIKRRAEELVGWGAAMPSLRTWQSFNTATDVLLKALENAGRTDKGARW